MSTSVCSRVTLTIQISEVLYDAIQVTAAMSQTTVPAFIGSTLRETQVAFFAEAGELADVVVLDAHATPPSTRSDHGALQSAIMDRLVGSPTEVYDLREVRKAMLHSHHAPAVSRAVHQLIERGLLVWMRPSGSGFRHNDGWESRVRYVRRGAGG